VVGERDARVGAVGGEEKRNRNLNQEMNEV
jgi:hypothetical protein